MTPVANCTNPHAPTTVLLLRANPSTEHRFAATGPRRARGHRRKRRRPSSWRGPESNWRHHDFQSCALPTELPRRSSPLIVASALLDRPHVAVRVLEEAEPGSGRALRAELLHLAYRDAALGQSGPHGVDVLHDELHALHRARLPQWQPY